MMLSALFRDRLLRVACETLQAVAFLNHHSIIHRSIDPENILIDDQVSEKQTLCQDGENNRVKFISHYMR